MPAGLNTARESPVHSPVGAVKTRRRLPVFASQRVIVSARVTVASCLPVGPQATELTISASEVPLSCCSTVICRPVVTSQTRAVPSHAEEAAWVPSGLNATS